MKMNDRGKEQESQSDNFFLRIIKSRYVTIFSFSRNNKIVNINNINYKHNHVIFGWNEKYHFLSNQKLVAINRYWMNFFIFVIIFITVYCILFRRMF